MSRVNLHPERAVSSGAMSDRLIDLARDSLSVDTSVTAG